MKKLILGTVLLMAGCGTIGATTKTTTLKREVKSIFTERDKKIADIVVIDLEIKKIQKTFKELQTRHAKLNARKKQLIESLKEEEHTHE